MSREEIRAVLFDLGGVILRTDDPEPRRLLAESVGCTYAELDEIVFGSPVAQLAERGQATSEQVWAEIGRRLRLDPAQVPAFRRAFFAGDKVDTGLVDLISRLRPAYRTGLLSNTWFRDLEGFLQDDLHIGGVFDVIISSARSGRAKPDPEIFQEALDALGTRAGETVFVDDNLENIQAASRLGFLTVHFSTVPQARAEFLALVDVPASLPGTRA